jgi:hypothetical protein
MMGFMLTSLKVVSMAVLFLASSNRSDTRCRTGSWGPAFLTPTGRHIRLGQPPGLGRGALGHRWRAATAPDPDGVNILAVDATSLAGSDQLGRLYPLLRQQASHRRGQDVGILAAVAGRRPARLQLGQQLARQDSVSPIHQDPRQHAIGRCRHLQHHLVRLDID